MSKGRLRLSGRRRKKEEQLQLLSSYFKIDTENRQMDIPLSFERYSDVFESSVGEVNGPHLAKDEIFDRIESAFKLRPRGYKVNIAIRIKDPEGHSIEDCKRGFYDALSLYEKSYIRRDRWKLWAALALLVFGLLFLIFNLLFNNLSWVDTESAAWKIVSEVLDIAAWVFIWESVTIYFIERPESKAFRHLFRTSLNRLEIQVGEENYVEAQG